MVVKIIPEGGSATVVFSFSRFDSLKRSNIFGGYEITEKNCLGYTFGEKILRGNFSTNLENSCTQIILPVVLGGD